jgi:tetratricopeptide (TPR) repeat protein
MPDLTPLLDAARQASWHERDLVKLETYAYHSCGDSHAVLRRLKLSLGTTDFDPDLFIIAIIALYRLGRFEEAYQNLTDLGDREHLFAGRSDFANTAALICQAANRPTETRRYIDTAWSLAPDDTTVALNAYGIYFGLGDLEAFEQVRETFQQGNHDLELSGFTLANVELAQGHYEEGFRLLEHRYQMQEAHRYLNRALFAIPRWQGERLQDKALLISAEQGLGDTIQMARFLPKLESSSAARLFMESQPETVTLLKFNFPQIEIIIREHGKTPPVKFDLWTGLMSLPHRLGTTANTVPGRSGYLNIPPDNSEYWCARVNTLARQGKPRIGLAWSGEPTHRADRRRSIPFALMMEAIRPIDADFFALQTHVPSDLSEHLINVSDEMITLADTAALIAEMDLIITVDTSIVHLAGAIGKETWLLLPYRYEWRWGLSGERNNWYESVKVLRQPTHGDWDSVLSDVFGHRFTSHVWSKQERQ